MRFAIMFGLAVGIVVGGETLHGQARPTATRLSSVYAGATYNWFSPDYGVGKIQGVGIFAGANFGRYLGIEGIIRRTDLVTPRDIGEQTYLIGPRFRYKIGRFSPYAKAMGGLGVFRVQLGYNPSSATGHFGVYSFGGGLDVDLTPHITLRAIDYEHQIWPGFQRNGLSPSGFSAGAAYRF